VGAYLSQRAMTSARAATTTHIASDTTGRMSAKRVFASIERIGTRPSDLRHIVLTHWHPDHMGSAAELRRLTGAQVAIHELDAPVPGGASGPRRAGG